MYAINIYDTRLESELNIHTIWNISKIIIWQITNRLDGPLGRPTVPVIAQKFLKLFGFIMHI